MKGNAFGTMIISKRRIISLLAALMILLSVALPVSAEEMSELQQNAVAMLNYITVSTQEIISSGNNRMYLEDAYSSMVNNVSPYSVDGDTLAQLMQMLDVLEQCRMLSVKRDRIQFLYDQEQASAIYKAIPDPLDIMAIVQATKNPEQAMAVANMVISSVANYIQASSEADMNMIQTGWELDDAEAELVHECRSNVFAYMISIVNQYNLPGNQTLTEKTVQEYVDWKNNNNVIAQIQFFESNKETYSTYGGYWLTLAECYYKNGDYEKCLEAIDEYQKLNIRIFRKDYDLGAVMPLAIVATQNTSGEEKNSIVEKYARILMNNTDNDNWSLRLYAAQTYLGLYTETNNTDYLKSAYQIELDNVNHLISKQRELNNAYLAPVQETQTPKDASNSQKEQIKKYNQALKENRKTELAPIYEPLRLNVDFLFELAKEMKIDDSEAARIDGILHPHGDKLFLIDSVDQLYWMSPAEKKDADPKNIEFAGTAIRIPVSYVSDDTSISVSVIEENGEETVLTDWLISEVKRDSDTNISDIHAIYMSEAAKQHSWGPNSTITVTVCPKTECPVPDIISKYTAEETKKGALDWLKVWEGHKNEWYDYLKVWENTVDFVYVEP